MNMKGSARQSNKFYYVYKDVCGCRDDSLAISLFLNVSDETLRSICPVSHNIRIDCFVLKQLIEHIIFPFHQIESTYNQARIKTLLSK